MHEMASVGIPATNETFGGEGRPVLAPFKGKKPQLDIFVKVSGWGESPVCSGLRSGLDRYSALAPGAFLQLGFARIVSNMVMDKTDRQEKGKIQNVIWLKRKGHL